MMDIYIYTVVTHKKHNSNIQSRVLQDRRGRGAEDNSRGQAVSHHCRA